MTFPIKQENRKERYFQMKKISILIPCYNEEENVGPISEEIVKTIERDLPGYDYELVFIDNDSSDNTRRFFAGSAVKTAASSYLQCKEFRPV